MLFLDHFFMSLSLIYSQKQLKNILARTEKPKQTFNTSSSLSAQEPFDS